MTAVDLARSTLLRAQTDARGRVDAATNAIVRVVAGGVGWNDSRTKAHRTALREALGDLGVATRALALLDAIDAETKR